MFVSSPDVLIMGAGPAGLSLAGACARLGMRVACVAPRPLAPWERSFAVWSCEVEAMGSSAVVEAAWQRPIVWLDDQTRIELPYAYARLDVAQMQARLLDACAAGSCAIRAGTVADVTHDESGGTVTLTSGEKLRAGVIVDATGPESPFIARSEGGPPAFQAAYGETLEIDGDADVEMSLMDYRSGGDDLPSFLYCLPLGGGRLFVEETVLASRPAASLPRLAKSLHARLARMGISRSRVSRVVSEERCVIPMGSPLPRPGQRVVPFGAAASLVHPATGYQVARTLALAPALAEALAGAPSPILAARRAYDVIWPAARRQSWALYTFGMEAICSFDRSKLRAFLRAFFALPDPTWLGFLRGTLSPAAIALAMGKVLLRADPVIRREMLRLVITQRQTLTRPWKLEDAV